MSSKGSSRVGRVGDVLHRELAKLIRDESKDPRLGMVTISGVEVSRDLSHARVFVTVMEDDKRDQSIEALNHAAGFFRSQLAKGVVLRSVPRLKFIYDESIVVGNRMSALIDSTKPINNEDEAST